MNSKQQEKQNNYIQDIYLAIKRYLDKDYDGACTEFRKSAEAFCKFIIYDKYGVQSGGAIIRGQQKTNGDPLPLPHRDLSLDDMIYCLSDEGLVSKITCERLYNLKDCCNVPSHDRNIVVTEKTKKDNADKAKNISEDLSHDLYSYIGSPIPELLNTAYQGIIEEKVSLSMDSPILGSFIQAADYFEPHNKYILLAPDSFDKDEVDKQWNLRKLPWSMIIDFNKNTKEANGLFHSFSPAINGHFTPILINKIDTSVITNGTTKNINWVFANGISNAVDSSAEDIKGWRKKRYNLQLTKILKEFVSSSQNPIYVVSLVNHPSTLTAVVNSLEAIPELEKDILHILVLSDKKVYLDETKNLDDFDFDVQRFEISRNDLFNRLTGFANDVSANHTDSILVPCTVDDKKNVVDISDIESRLKADDIDVIHINIAHESNDSITIPDFFMGNTIQWEELSEGIDVKRERYDILRQKVINQLTIARRSCPFYLNHKPGAGGTTISRRLAYDLRKEVPVILIHKYDHRKTVRDINALYNKVKCNILAIIESSEVNRNSIDALIRECNVQKRTVLFLIVERNNKTGKRLDPSIENVEDRMADQDEKNRFLSKTKAYSKNQVVIKELVEKSYARCEVIDFALTIAEDHYNPLRLREYIKSYTAQLPEPVIQFLRHVCFVYHYSQKPLSSLIVRDEFKNNKGEAIGLNRFLTTNGNVNFYVRKIITQDSEENDTSVYWRPRYSQFAEATLDVLSGSGVRDKWKEMIPELSMSLIQKISENNRYLTEDNRQLLNAVFLERGKEDPLGQEEDWDDKTINEHFSQLIQDIGDRPDEQKAVLLNLAKSFPEVPHFWGHLARYCYEKADTPEEFLEAENYITKAFKNGGDNDFNLQHIAGMCIRRLIEFHKRNQDKLEQDELVNLTEKSKGYFEKSRDINPKNIHAYVSEFQLLCTVIEYGKALSGIDDFPEFLTSDEHSWYLEQYNTMCNLVSQSEILLDQMQSLGKTAKLSKSRGYVATNESETYRFFGNYREALRHIEKRITEVDNIDKPRLRLLYVRTLLLWKVRGRRDEMREAWESLSTEEINKVDNFLRANISQGGANVFSLRLWLLLVRYADVDYDIDSIKSNLRLEFQNSVDSPMLHMETAYYLYILNAFELIKNGGSPSERRLNEINEYISVSKSLSVSNKFSYEYLANIVDFKGIINHKYRNDDIRLCRLNGIILEILNEKQGTIQLPCGLTAVFSPSANKQRKFVKGVDETTEVSFVIGFRHDGLYAFEVQKIGEESEPDHEELKNENEIVDISDNDEVVENEQPTGMLPEDSNKNDTGIYKTESERNKLHVKIVGKIKL